MSRDDSYAMQHKLLKHERELKELKREHAKNIRGLNFKYENEVKKEEAEQEIKDQAKVLENLTLDWRKAKDRYILSEQALKEGKERSWCTIS
jgi:glycerophosphoryl diester phosphodiesterase